MKAISRTVLGLLALAVIAGVPFAQQPPEAVSEGKGSKKSRHWLKNEGEIILRDERGVAIKRLIIKNEEKTISTHPEHKFTERKMVATKGGVSDDGKFAWVDQRESTWLLNGNKGANLFQYYDQEGNILWENRRTVGTALSGDGQVVALLEADPKAIAINDQGNTFSRPKVFSSSGKVLLDLSECRTYSVITLTKNGRYGAVQCSGTDPKRRVFHLLFDVEKKLKIQVSTPGIEVHEDGTYTAFSSEQDFDPATKKYGAFVRKNVSHGRIE